MKSLHLHKTALVIAGWAMALPLNAEMVTIVADRDNTLIEDAGGALSDGSGQNFFAGRTGQGVGFSIRRGLIHFDVAGSVPAGSTINSASLRLNMSRTRFIAARTISLHRVDADWGEGTSNAAGEEGVGAASTANDATWIHRFYNTDFWIAPGGDFSATPSGSRSVGAIGAYTWTSTPEMVADAQLWLDSPGDNFGWIVIGDESAASTAKRFDTSEHPTVNNRPQLTIDFTPPPDEGACCDESTGVCTDAVTFDDCALIGGRFGGTDSTCATLDPPCVAEGACCDDVFGECTEGVTQADCEGAGNRFGGDGSTCASIDPPCLPPPTGACCIELDGICDLVSAAACDLFGGRYGGDNTDCGDLAPPCEPVISVSLETVASGLIAPVQVTHAGDGSGRLFIVDQGGFIRVVDADGDLLPTPFLDLTTKIVTLNPGFDERGALGLAFHPDYATNGRFFVRYSAPRTGEPDEPCFGTSRGCHSEVLAEYVVSGDPNVGDLASEIILFSIAEPEFNHNSGHVAFGPDGYLYFTLGDGGGRDDGLSNPNLPHGPIGNAQNIETFLGSMIRIDVDSLPDPGLAYAIPPDNPRVGLTGLDELYAWGFRNPFTFAFDDGPGGDGSLFVADVGQELFEEINIVDKGGNYGWVIREGFHCFDPNDPVTPPVTCATTGTILGDPLIDPVLEYLQPLACASDADCAAYGVGCGIDGQCLNEGGVSVIVGGVYRGSSFAQLTGKLVFGDFASGFLSPSGRVYYADTEGPNAFQRRQFFLAPSGQALGRFVKGMGEDENGELYVCTSMALAPTGTSGEVLRFSQPLAGASGDSARYISITPPAGLTPVALVVTPDCPAGVSKYVGAPSGPDNTAYLVDNPASAAFLDAASWGGVVHVTDVDLAADTQYKIQLDTGAPGMPQLSAAVTATTAIWGDTVGAFLGGMWTPPDGIVAIQDVVAILERFRAAPSAPPRYRVDLIGVGQQGMVCRPDQSIDILDAIAALDAFMGVTFEEGTPCVLPCP